MSANLEARAERPDRLHGSDSGHTTAALRPAVLLWNHPRTVLLCAVAAVATIIILLAQMRMRQGVFDPESVRIFPRLFLFQDYPASLLYLTSLLLALVPAIQRAAANLTAKLAKSPRVVALLSFIVLMCGAFFVYHRHPLALDEYAPYLQSQIFAALHVVGRYPVPLIDWLIFPSFQDYFIHVSSQTGEFASAYWPGFALLLTPFTAVNLAWICNPLIGAASLLALFGLTRRLTASPFASGACVLFALASPAFTINAMSFYSMPAHLLLNAVFALLLLEPSPKRALSAGAVGGFALILHNPVPHALFAIPWLIWLMSRKDRVSTLTAITLGYLPWIAVFGFGWQYVLLSLADAPQVATASARVADISRLADLVERIFSFPTAAVVEARLIGVAKLWLWASPALIVLATIGVYRWRRDTRVLLLLASAVVTFVGYLFVPMDQGHGWGFRYFHSAWFVLPVFAAISIASPQTLPLQSYRPALDPLLRFGLGAALVGALVLQPYFSWQVRDFIDDHLTQIPTVDRGVPAVIILNPGAGYYAQDLIRSDPYLRHGVIVMGTRGRASDQEMMREHFPDLTLLSTTFGGTVWGKPE